MLPYLTLWLGFANILREYCDWAMDEVVRHQLGPYAMRVLRFLRQEQHTELRTVLPLINLYT